MTTEQRLITELYLAIKNAIAFGDWVVDGRCDPDMALAHTEKYLRENGLLLDDTEGEDA